ncbi:MAG: hypothetical protein ABIT04_06125 [Novosphingobium sp.]
MAGLKISGKRAGNRAVGAAQDKLAKVEGPSPNPMTNLVITDVAMRAGGRLLRHLAERALLGAKFSPETAKGIVQGRSMKQTLIGTALARFATSSVPGGLIVGGGMLAKSLYDRKKGKGVAGAEGNASIAKQVKRR